MRQSASIYVSYLLIYFDFCIQVILTYNWLILLRGCTPGSALPSQEMRTREPRVYIYIYIYICESPGDCFDLVALPSIHSTAPQTKSCWSCSRGCPFWKKVRWQTDVRLSMVLIEWRATCWFANWRTANPFPNTDSKQRECGCGFPPSAIKYCPTAHRRLWSCYSLRSIQCVNLLRYIYIYIYLGGAWPSGMRVCD